jgi:O-methyltransferase
MKSTLGKVIFRVSRILLSKFGYEVKLGSSAVLYPELSELEIAFIRRIFANSLTMTSFDSLCTLAIACKSLSKEGVPGDFVEVGIWRGGSSLVAKRFLSGDRDFYLYDTYAGMTEPSQYDFRIGSRDSQDTMEKWESEQKATHNGWVFASLDEVQQNFRSFDLLDGSVNFIKGDVRETLLSESIPKKIALLRLDTDFYDSTLVELQRLWPKLVSKGVLILDDYGHWDGARKAVDDFFSQLGHESVLMIPISGGGGRLIIKT